MPAKGDVTRYSFTEFDELEWMRDPNPCKSENTNLFFPVHGGTQQQRAIAICRTCPNRLPCLEYALVTQVDYGVWGGTGERERRRILRSRRSVA